MNLVSYQQCRSLYGWQPVMVESSTTPDARYRVDVNPFGNSSENICECQGYQFRGRCRHQEEARDQVCGWSEIRSKEEQSDRQRKMKICPRCGGGTTWEVDFEDGD